MTYYTLPPTLSADIEKYAGLVAKAEKGEVDKITLKPNRVPMGIYEQREDDTYMVRIRLPGGALSVEQFRVISRVARAYSGRPLHFTTRQDVQIHGARLADTPAILLELKASGLSPRGGGGNTVRNIIGSLFLPAAGNGGFDVAPYVRALTSRLIAEPDSWTLPRKFKIAFSSDASDSSLATVNDLGFIAKVKDGGRGFSVYLGGGMGGRPAIGLKIFDFIAPTEVYNVARAAKNIFDRYGNRRNKHRARLRFLRYDRGDEAFVELFRREYEAVREKNPPPLELGEAEPSEAGRLEVPLFKGDLPLDQAEALAGVLAKYEGVSLRATLAQNLVVVGISPAREAGLQAELDGLFGAPLPEFVARSAACAGASTCRLGTCLSRNLLEAIREKLTAEKVPLEKSADLSLKISGCPNTCAQHIIADIGLFGIARRRFGRPYPAYELVLGGLVREGETRFAEKAGVLPARAVPALLADFLRFLAAARGAEEDFRGFLTRIGWWKIRELVLEHEKVPDFESDRSYYYDWFEDKPFSTAGKSSGECAAGLFDLIELDLRAAAEKLRRGQEASGVEAKTLSAREAATDAARALLVTKGLEAANDVETLLLFKDHFIGRHVDEAWNDLVNRVLAKKPVGLEEAERFHACITGVYQAMDDSLKFPEIPARPAAALKAAAVKEYDFRGVPCPLNFVKVKLALEEAGTGDEIKRVVA